MVNLRPLTLAAVFAGYGRSIDELKVDLESAVGFGCSAIARSEGDAVLGGRSGDKRIIDSASGDAEFRKPAVESLRTCSGQEPRTGEIVCEQLRHGRRSSPVGRRQPGQHRECLEGRMTAQTATTVADGLPDGSMMFVASRHESDRDARVDQKLRPVIAGRHRAASGLGHR